MAAAPAGGRADSEARRDASIQKWRYETVDTGFKCSECGAIVPLTVKQVADSMSKHMERKHPAVYADILDGSSLKPRPASVRFEQARNHSAAPSRRQASKSAASQQLMRVPAVCVNKLRRSRVRSADVSRLCRIR